jgi:recombination protein RecA
MSGNPTADLVALVNGDLTRVKAASTMNLLSERPVLEHISTGSISLDWNIGPYCPGIPLGRISQAYGLEQGGKSRLMCQIINQAQLAGYPAFLADTENHYTKEWFARFGGNKEQVADAHPSTLEELLMIIEFAGNALIKKGHKGGVFITDSLQGVMPQAAKEADAAYSEGLGAAARILSSRLDRVKDIAREANMAVMFVGQCRERIGTMHRGDNKYYTPGGNTLHHLCVLRLFMKYIGAINSKVGRVEDRVGFTARVKTRKNNVGGRVPNYSTEIEFGDFGQLDDTMSLFEIAAATGVINHRGGGNYDSEHIEGLSFRGREKWRDVCTPEIRDEVARLIFLPEFCLRQEASALVDRDVDSAAGEDA